MMLSFIVKAKLTADGKTKCVTTLIQTHIISPVDHTHTHVNLIRYAHTYKEMYTFAILKEVLTDNLGNTCTKQQGQ